MKKNLILALVLSMQISMFFAARVPNRNVFNEPRVPTFRRLGPIVVQEPLDPIPENEVLPDENPAAGVGFGPAQEAIRLPVAPGQQVVPAQRARVEVEVRRSSALMRCFRWCYRCCTCCCS